MSDALAILAAIVTVAGGTAVLSSAEPVSGRSGSYSATPLAAPADPSGLTLQTEPSPGKGKVFAATGSINGHDIHFLVDTGSTVTILTPSDARKAGIVASGDRMLTGIGGSVVAGTASADLAIYDQTLPDITVMIAPDAKYSLLGLNALHAMGQPRLSFH